MEGNKNPAAFERELAHDPIWKLKALALWKGNKLQTIKRRVPAMDVFTLYS